MSLTASRVTAESAVISWTIHTCFGTVAKGYSLYWYPIGDSLENGNFTFINSSTINQYNITGLSPSKRYYIALSLGDNNYYCTFRNAYSTLAEAMLGEFIHVGP